MRYSSRISQPAATSSVFSCTCAFRDVFTWSQASLFPFSRVFPLPPAKAARPAAEVARRRGELGLEAGLASAFVAAAPQTVTPDQFAVGAFDRVALAHAAAVLRGLAEIPPRLDRHVVLRHLERPSGQLVPL